MLEQVCFQIRSGSGGVGVRAAERFGHDFIHKLEFEQLLGGDFEGGGGFGGGGAVSPQNRRATFGGDDGIISIFQKQNAVGHADAQRAARTAFANHGGNNRNLEQRHLAQI